VIERREEPAGVIGGVGGHVIAGDRARDRNARRPPRRFHLVDRVRLGPRRHASIGVGRMLQPARCRRERRIARPRFVDG